MSQFWDSWCFLASLDVLNGTQPILIQLMHDRSLLGGVLEQNEKVMGFLLLLGLIGGAEWHSEPILLELIGGSE